MESRGVARPRIGIFQEIPPTTRSHKSLGRDSWNSWNRRDETPKCGSMELCEEGKPFPLSKATCDLNRKNQSWRADLSHKIITEELKQQL